MSAWIIRQVFVVLRSSIDYFVDGAATDHALARSVPPAGGGVLEVAADGDYGFPGETPSVSAEGTLLGSVGVTGTDCVPAEGAFDIDGNDLAALAADGVVNVHLQNGYEVNVFSAVNRHEVRLVYRRSADQADFGPVYVGARPHRRLLVQNSGNDVLELSSIASDNPAFTASASSLVVPAGATIPLDVIFAPSAPGPFAGTLTLLTNDPDEGTISVALLGEGVPPPNIEVAPSELWEACNGIKWW